MFPHFKTHEDIAADSRLGRFRVFLGLAQHTKPAMHNMLLKHHVFTLEFIMVIFGSGTQLGMRALSMDRKVALLHQSAMTHAA